MVILSFHLKCWIPEVTPKDRCQSKLMGVLEGLTDLLYLPCRLI
jgi:hypothetical protein